MDGLSVRQSNEPSASDPVDLELSILRSYVVVKQVNGVRLFGGSAEHAPLIRLQERSPC